MNWKRGAIRLWVIASIIWIGGVIVVERPDLPPAWSRLDPAIPPLPPGFVLDKPPGAMDWTSEIEHATLDALAPPLVLLALGFGGAWVWRGLKP